MNKKILLIEDYQIKSLLAFMLLFAESTLGFPSFFCDFLGLIQINQKAPETFT